jgi:septum formation protein
MRLLLASASPRRGELLRAAGFTFETLVVDVDETPRANEAPREYVRRLAVEKSAAAWGPAKAGDYSDDETVILAADTTVVIDGEILGKPRDDADAASMLRRLSGRTHEVLTGVSLRTGDRELSQVEVTRVEFAPVEEADVAWYVASGEGRDKAGAYAIQGLASRFVTRIEGSYPNVVGLPVASVVALLKQIGFVASLA